MTTELTIQQKIYAGFIEIGEIQKAIDYAESRELTDEEKIEALSFKLAHA